MPRLVLVAGLLLAAGLMGCASTGPGGAVLVRPEFRIGGSGGIGYIPPPLVIQTTPRQPVNQAPAAPPASSGELPAPAQD